MKVLVDMNLSPDWCGVLRQQGWEAVHWSAVGDPRASDRTILDYARQHGYTVFTHDLDFGAILASTRSNAPSVIQVRAQDVMSNVFETMVVYALRQFQNQLENGALVIIDESRVRARVLPLG